MKVQNLPTPQTLRPLSQQPPGDQPQTPPQVPSPGGDGPEDRFQWKPVFAAAGGTVAGLGAGIAASYGTTAVSSALGRVMNATMPAISGLPGGTAGLLLTAAGAALLGSAVAVAAGARVGGQIAYQAAAGASKPDVTQSGTPKGAQKYQQNAAELRDNLGRIAEAPSVKAAASAGFRAGASLGGPAGARVGVIQGVLLGAAMGGIAGIPLLTLVSHPAVLLPGAVAGAFLGAKIGEPVGYACGAVGVGAVTAAGSAVYRAVKGGPKDSGEEKPPQA